MKGVRKLESNPQTPEPLHTRVPEWQVIAYDNVFSSFPSVRGIDQSKKYSEAAGIYELAGRKVGLKAIPT